MGKAARHRAMETIDRIVNGNSALPARPATWFRVALSFLAITQSCVSRQVPTEVSFSQCTRPPPSSAVEDSVPTRIANGHEPSLHSVFAHQVYKGYRAS